MLFKNANPALRTGLLSPSPSRTKSSPYNPSPYVDASGGCRIGYISTQTCALLPPVRLGPPCWRPMLNATTSSLYARRCTNSLPLLEVHLTSCRYFASCSLVQQSQDCPGNHPAWKRFLNNGRRLIARRQS